MTDARRLARLAAAAIGGSIAIMVAASLLRRDWMFPHLRLPATGPPWELPGPRVPAGVVIVLLWLAALAGAGGVAAGLIAVRRGARPSVRMLLVAAAAAAIALTVLPPAGSSDALDYAAYGRIAALGHSPYRMTPLQLRRTDYAFARSVPRAWQGQVSVYGPVATGEQFIAAKLGGDSMARTVFWLKLFGLAAFAAVAAALDRMLRSDPAQRLRAHLLWTINPLLLWDLLAGGHIDVVAAAAGLLGLLAVSRRQDAAPPGLARSAVAGGLIGLAGDIKINYILLGAGVAWALRRSPSRLGAAAAAALAVLAGAYAPFGLPAIRAVLNRRAAVSADSFYGLIGWPAQSHGVAGIAAALITALAVLLMIRLPAAPGLPAIRPAIAVSAAWLFLWPYQLPWYDAMIICVLALFPASRLDWLVLARLTAGSVANIPGNPWAPRDPLVALLDYRLVGLIAPLVMLAAVAGLVLLALSGRWRPSGPGLPPGAPPGGVTDRLRSAAS